MKLAVNQSEPGAKRFRRNYLACCNCRLRKVRCDLGDPSQPNAVCARCRRERRACVFEKKKRRSVDPSMQPSNDMKHLDLKEGAEQHLGALEKDGSSRHFSTVNGALQFLANAVGIVAGDENKVDPPHRVGSESSLGLPPTGTPVNDDRIPLTMLSLVPCYMNNSIDIHSSPTLRARSGGTPMVPPIRAESAVNKLRDSMNFPQNASSYKIPTNTLQSTHNLLDLSSLIHQNDSLISHLIQTELRHRRNNHTEILFAQPELLNRTDSVVSENASQKIMQMQMFDQRASRATSLEDIDYIGKFGILLASEAEYFIRMFFATLHPFYPHTPKFLHLPKVLCGYPLLLCTILTISARYHALDHSSDGNVPKNIQIHDRLWLHAQAMISRTVWAEASMRSIGTVFAFLLFTEWNPRAIHWRSSDYANKAEDLTDTLDADSMARDFPMNSAPEPAGLGAMRRSYRMAWMFIGSAVRLAQDMAFMESSSCTFVATHIAEINSFMNMKRQSMLSHSLAELELMGYDISETDMERHEENQYNVNNMKFKEPMLAEKYHTLLFTEIQRAHIELLQIISLGHESLYGYKAQLGCLTQRQNLAILNILNPMFKNWNMKYKKFLVPTKSKITASIQFDDVKNGDPSTKENLQKIMVNESLIFDFNYTRLYIFSLALSPSTNSPSDHTKGKSALKIDEISKSATYIEQAFSSANEILQVAHRVHKLNMLRYMPVRWVTKVVRAVAFIVKCYLTITAHNSTKISNNSPSSWEDFDVAVLSLSLISVDQIVKSIYDAAVTLRDCSPDELHLCTSYSKILFYLYSEMKSTCQKTTCDENASDVVPVLAQEISPKEHQDTSSANATTSPKNISDLGFVPENDLMDWFINNKEISGLDFVGPWTELIEQQLEKDGFEF